MLSLDATYRPLLEAVSFAARAHHGQLRKDGRTPYASHVFRVCLVVRHVFGLDDPTLLTAALLHDTVEDTTTDFDDVAEKYGTEVATWVAFLSKDKRLPDAEREERYRKTLADAPWQVKACKLADVFDNLLDSQHLDKEKRRRTVARSRYYVDALDEPKLPANVQAALQLVRQLLTEVENTLA